MLYFFILGHNPTLSIAEVLRIFTNFKDIRIATNIKGCSQEVLLLETNSKIDAQRLQRQLGGIVKIGEVISRSLLKSDLNRLSRLILKLLPDKDKVYFGFSAYKLDDSVGLKKFLPEIKKLAIKTKRVLQEQGLKARWVVSREKALSSVIVRKNKLLSQGAEIVFLIGKDKIYIGKTLAVQEFEEYSFRDWQRPEKRIEAGMLPPKLAKIMLNLALPNLKGATILDPFCGSGTILQEAILMGYKNVVGADINKQAAEASKKNLNWIAKQYSIFNIQYSIFQADARELSKKLKPNSIDAIVTEPYLGPIRIKNYELGIKKIIQELSGLYLAVLREFKKILRKDGKIVIIFPVFKIGRRAADMPILDEIRKLGYKIEIPIPEELRKHPVIKITSRGSIIYCRPDQRVLREIFVFR